MQKRLDIQGLRAVAVLMVVIFHAGIPLPGGYLGVDMFFVISGFIITTFLNRELVSTGTIRLRVFFLKRLKRLGPALAATLVFTVLASIFLASPSGTQQSIFLTSLGASFLVANAAIIGNSGGYFDSPTQLNALLHTWSLSVEEQFYLFLPLFALLLWQIGRRTNSRNFFAWGFLAVTLVSFVFFVFGFSGTYPRLRSAFFGYYSPLPRVWEFGIGCLAAILLPRFRELKISSTARTWILWGSFLSMMATASFGALSSGWPNMATPLICIATALLIVFSDDSSPNFVIRNLGSKVLVFVGDRSYSLYLWHFPIIALTSALLRDLPFAPVLGALISLIPAHLSYKYIETPWRSRETIGTRQLLKLISATTVMPIVVAASALFGASNGWWSSDVKAFQSATTRLHLDATSGCDQRIPLPGPDSCTWIRSSDETNVYLLGDSNAGHFSEGILAASAETGMNLTIATTSACPFLAMEFYDTSGEFDNNACKKYVDYSFRYLKNQEDGVVIISNSNRYWTEHPYLVGKNGVFKDDVAFKQAEFEEALETTVHKLSSYGHRIVLVQSVPKWLDETFWNPSECFMIEVWNSKCSANQTLASWNSKDGVFREIIASTADKLEANVWDFGKDLCPLGKCSTKMDSKQYYRDAGHISIEASESLKPRIQLLLEQVPKLD